MPYIKQQSRERLKYVTDAINISYPVDAGELNFLITTLIKAYLKNYPECYAKYNDIIGALESAKLELYRRKVADYENDKITDNGDVY